MVTRVAIRVGQVWERRRGTVFSQVVVERVLPSYVEVRGQRGSTVRRDRFESTHKLIKDVE